MSIRSLLRGTVAAAILVTLCEDYARSAAADAAPANIDQLLSGVREIAAPGVPGPLCVYGPRAAPVVAGKLSRENLAPVVAAAEYGKGRAVAFGHPGYFDVKTLEAADTGTLMTNAVAWASGRKSDARRKLQVVTVHHPQLAKFFEAKGFVATDVDLRGLAAAMNGADVVVLDVAAINEPRPAEALLAHVKKGRGLVVASLGWGWAQLNPGKSLVDDHPGNRLLSALGIAWADGYLERTAGAGYKAGGNLPPTLHAGRALEAVIKGDQGKPRLTPPEMAQAAATVSLAIRTLRTEESQAFSRIRAWTEEHAGELVPTHQKPIKTGEGLKRLAITVQTIEPQRLAPDKVAAHPAAVVFPGPVPDEAERVRRVVEVDTAVPGWHSTGLYAPPGGAIDVAVPEPAAGKGLFVRIGCHSDTLWDQDQWRRCPEICIRRRLAERITRVASPFGGLLYVEVPDRCTLGRIRVGLRGAVDAPYFLLGTTTANEWKTIRRRPAPWAELASERVALAVPSKAIRDLDDPVALMETWNRVLDACADLAAIPRERHQPERYAADEQISAGYMHSGYPIMTHLDAVESMTRKDRLLAGNWGLFHEMGHNHQNGDWTFDGTGEVTCNLFSLYVCETVCRLRGPGHEAVLLGEARSKAYRTYAATGPDFGKWKSDPFLALTMYVQLREGFGWEAYKKVFAEYRGLPADQRPKSDQEKRDQWMVRFSRTVGKNLGPFFQAWGVPVSESARASVAGLPAWMPEGFPPK